MEKTTDTNCNHEAMVTCYLALNAIMQELNTAYQTVCEINTDFQSAYEGDAKEEIDMFLTNLPRQIYRLALFYEKMASFVMLTSQSFQESDNKMVENVEG